MTNKFSFLGEQVPLSDKKHVHNSSRFFHRVAAQCKRITLLNAAWSYPKQKQDVIGPELTMPPLMKITYQHLFGTHAILSGCSEVMLFESV